MSTSTERAQKLIQQFSRLKPFETVLEEIKQKNPAELAELQVPGAINWSPDSQRERLEFIRKNCGISMDWISGKNTFSDTESLRGNIEQYIGMTMVPTGIAGPVRVNGTLANGDFYVPMATTEGALIASYTRGARATRQCGGVTSVCLTEAVQRAPVFRFESLSEVGQFMQYILANHGNFQEIISQHSRFAKLQDLRLNMEGNQVMVIFEYTTGDAAGQNMATICTDALCRHILAHCPLQPKDWYIESNYSGDKKATSVSFSTVRGKKVTAESHISREVVHSVLSTTPEAIAQYWQTSSVAAVQSGSIGIQGHFANGLTAIFLACGQDVACVAEAYVGITRMEVTKDGGLYVAVTLPSLLVGTVGGGTHLPTQNECLRLLNCQGPESARKLAEICGATVLCGELSIAAALAGGHFSKAHKIFGRKKPAT